MDTIEKPFYFISLIKFEGINNIFMMKINSLRLRIGEPLKDIAYDEHK